MRRVIVWSWNRWDENDTSSCDMVSDFSLYLSPSCCIFCKYDGWLRSPLIYLYWSWRTLSAASNVCSVTMVFEKFQKNQIWLFIIPPARDYSLLVFNPRSICKKNPEPKCARRWRCRFWYRSAVGRKKDRALWSLEIRACHRSYSDRSNGINLCRNNIYDNLRFIRAYLPYVLLKHTYLTFY